MNSFSLSHCDAGRGEQGNFVFLKCVSGFTTKSFISSLFVHGFSPKNNIIYKIISLQITNDGGYLKVDLYVHHRRF